jgi:hypothetical protein
VDFVLWGQAGVRLLKNEWDREADRRELVVIEPDPPLPEAGAVHALEVADLDMDGDLDLLLSTDSGVKLWSSRSNWSFDDITSNSLLPPADLRVTGAFGFDLDRDIDVDVLLCTSEGPIGYLENLRHKTFRWRALDVPRVASAAAIEPLDLDGNASWDFVTGGAEVQLVLTRTPERGRLVIERAASVSGAPVGGLTTWDYDNDGRTDVLAWNSDRPSFFRGTADGELDYAGNLLDGVAVPAPLLRCDVGDLDGDGDLDLLLAGGSGIVLCSNEGGDSHHSLGITVAAQFSLGKENQQTRRSNHYGTGSLLELKAGERFQQQVIRRQRTHFGLGRAEHADVARLTWTNGCPQNIMEPEQGRTYCEIGTAKGSCPFVYAWDGQQFAFVTDLCWGAPLGLQNAEGGLVPCRDWEYILIPGECLAPREGRYVLQTTEELWEAAYFDQVRLMAVDHPAEIEVYSNEKVGPPDISQFLIHTVHKRRYPVSVVNHRGRDLLRELSARDGVFARPFDRALMQGYTEDTYIEIDLGDVSPRAELARTFSGDATAEAEVGGRKITLFLTGWLLPTDTTINVALVENPDLPAPKPPAILVPDTDGEWREVRPFMGFPGGKTKTIAVNLTGIFPTDDRRLRIATSMQLYWDEIFFTVDEEPGRIEVRDLALVSADLHYRGFSRRIPRPHHAPAWFEYAAVRSEPAWPPMGGSFTRYGDVTALVRDADDVQVVMTSGDEMTLEFAVPEAPLPDGWTRDFIMYSIGWDKDADLHTLLGQVSEPLPFRGHTSYPYPPEQFPDSRVHRDWLRDYQTRTIDDLAFRRLIHAWEPGVQLESP